MVRPKKHLGQHFLTDPAIARRIVQALDSPSGDAVLEIGPGKGILTEWLLEQKKDIIPVEIDSESVTYLKERWPDLADRLVEGDFLKLELEHFSSGKMHIIGNFPYNISSQIFFKILENRNRVDSVVCMLQKEVAERIASPPGSKKYGILSVLLQTYYHIEYLFSVKPGSFHPPPKVNSGVIRMKRNMRSALPCDENLFQQVVKTAFNQRRKMIRNSLQSILLNLDSQYELLSRRPEQLDVQQFIDLTSWVAGQPTHTTDPLKPAKS